MKDLLILLAHLLTTIAKLMGPGGAKAIVANSLLMKQQLLAINRTRQRRTQSLSTRPILARLLVAVYQSMSPQADCHNYPVIDAVEIP